MKLGKQMSIHIHAYSAFTKEETDKINQIIKFEFPIYFNCDFIIYEADDLNGYGKEIAVKDVGIPASFKADFLISLNNKSATSNIFKVALIIKERYGSENIILMQNGDVRI